MNNFVNNNVTMQADANGYRTWIPTVEEEVYGVASVELLVALCHVYLVLAVEDHDVLAVLVIVVLEGH